MTKSSIAEEEGARLVSSEELNLSNFEPSGSHGEACLRREKDLKDSLKFEMPYDQSRRAITAKFDMCFGQHSIARVIWMWKAEIVSCFAALTAFVAIVIFIILCDHQPRQRWPFKFSLNSVVSVMGTVLKSCILFALAECEYRKHRNAFSLTLL